MPRRKDLDVAKGLAITLVVFGHIVARGGPSGVSWYEPLRQGVYQFHMPFFLYLSGFAASISGSLPARLNLWPGYARKRMWRLLVPFIGMGLLIVFGKCLAQHFMFVDNAPVSLSAGLAGLLWHTQTSAAASVWYLFVLFIYSLATPLLLFLTQGRRWALLVLGMMIYPLHTPPFLYADHLTRYALFFACGIMAGRYSENSLWLICRLWRFLLPVFLILLIGFIWRRPNLPAAFTLCGFGLLSMPALHGLAINMPPSCAQVFLWLGRYSFMIYLFNTICIGLTKAMLLHFVSWDGACFLPIACLLLTSGLLGPILLKHYGLRHLPGLYQLTN